MRKIILLLLVIAICISVYLLIPAFRSPKTVATDKENKMFPRALYLTTGLNEGDGELSEGVSVAIQSLSKKGVFVWLDTRDVLMKPDVLSGFSLMIIPTSIGYHDGDKKYSLTYMSDLEMENISNWVKNGGVLITEENIGRNTLEEIDRADLNGELNPKTWKLSEMFGIKMKERDLSGYSIEETNIKVWNGRIKEPITDNEWVLIPTEIISDKVKVLAEWVNGNDKIPAIIQNDFGKGRAILLTSTYLLHPSNDGGVSGIEQIEKFYDSALNNFSEVNDNHVEVNPWPKGNSSAFCISFNSDGTADKYSVITDFLKRENLPATFFIDSLLSEDSRKILDDNKSVTLQSNLYSRKDLSVTGYSNIAREILMNQQIFNIRFTGIRFPFYSPDYWGLLFANDNGYVYDSSIGVDHLTNYTGSVFPYNIPVSHDSYYKTLNLLEICPLKNDDVFFYQKSEAGQDYTEDMQRTDSQLFEKYLNDFYEYAILQNNGVMVFQGTPAYSGFSEITMLPLKRLVDTLKTKNCWMTTLEEVADYRNKLKDLKISILSETANNMKLKIVLPDQTVIKGFSLKFKTKPSDITTGNKYDQKISTGVNYMISDIKNGDEFDLTFP